MIFKKKTWIDRIVEFAGRRTLSVVSGSVDKELLVDVYRSEGAVTQAGDAFSAVNMNNLEQRVEDACGDMLTATLGAGTQTVAFTNAKIKSTSIIDIYTDVFGIVPKSQSISGNTLTLTFDAQNIAVGVAIIVREVK